MKRTFFTVLVSIVIVAFFVFSAIQIASAREYLITDLGPGKARAINNHGQVVGESGGNAVLWDGASKIILGQGSANDINDSGQIVGGTWNHYWLPGEKESTFFWQAGVIQELELSSANAINNRGEIVGSAWFAVELPPPPGWWYWDEEPHAALWRAGLIYDLGVYGPRTRAWPLDSHAFDINDWADVLVVGQYGINNGAEHEYGGFRWIEGEEMVRGPGGGLEDSRYGAYGVNSFGAIVGITKTNARDFRAFSWTKEDGRLMLDRLEETGGPWGDNGAYKINDQGTIVGWVNKRAYSDPESPRFLDVITYACLWNDDGSVEVLDDLVLNGSDWHLEVACDINASGQIVGYGTHNGQEHAFLLTPVAIEIGIGGSFGGGCTLSHTEGSTDLGFLLIVIIPLWVRLGAVKIKCLRQ